MFRIIFATFSLAVVIFLGSCSGDDPAEPGGGNGGGNGTGVAYEIPPFEVVRHGISLRGVWTDGEVTVTVGGWGIAFVQSAAGRFILPVNECASPATVTLDESLSNRHIL